MFITNTYKVFSVFLNYPCFGLKDQIFISFDLLKKEGFFSDIYLKKIYNFICYIKDTDLLFLQEKYILYFDRKKTFSLYLFEHIHGESRERGMAMIDLKNLYKISNFEIDVSGELPDFIPLFLEYLSVLDSNKSSILLSEIVNIISVIGNRLRLCDNLYCIVFEFLEYLSSVKPDKTIINKVLFNNENDKLQGFNIDQEWEEPRVFN